MGTTVEYWLEAFDANDVSGPGVGQSEHFTARVVSDQDKLVDVMNRTNDIIQSFNGTTDTEDAITKRLGALINDKAGSGGF